MDREKCENLMIDMAKDMWDTYKQYNPAGKYLTFYAIEDETGVSICVGNDVENDKEKPIDKWKYINYGNEEDNEDE